MCLFKDAMIPIIEDDGDADQLIPTNPYLYEHGRYSPESNHLIWPADCPPYELFIQDTLVGPVLVRVPSLCTVGDSPRVYFEGLLVRSYSASPICTFAVCVGVTERMFLFRYFIDLEFLLNSQLEICAYIPRLETRGGRLSEYVVTLQRPTSGEHPHFTFWDGVPVRVG